MTHAKKSARVDRRTMLLGSSALSGLALLGSLVRSDPAFAQSAQPDNMFTGSPKPFSQDALQGIAKGLAKTEFSKPSIELPDPFNKLSYDQYRDIRFKTDKAIWRPDRLDFELQLLPMGWLYSVPVEVWLVDNGQARQLKADGEVFNVGRLLGASPKGAPFGFSGFRIHGPLNRSDVNDEYVVFQGASYFRAIGRHQQYGLSARGLAMDTAQPTGEEFPIFRAFYVEKPQPGAPEIIVHALLDSRSVTGSYRFVIRPGDATVMDVDAMLFPRRTLTHVGLAPLTSMFLHGSANNRVNSDFRPAVHDSEGLAILNGKGERIWRPLANPRKLQVSAFIDKNPKGFGLAQRDRAFSAFEDLEARYERRPTAWVEPKGGWGDGYVELIEIPTEEEIHDNIVVYWKPAKPLSTDVAHSFRYRLHWSSDVPATWNGAWVHKTFIGSMKKADTQRFVIDFEGPAVANLKELPVAQLGVSAGRAANLVVQRHPEINGVRVAFEFNTSDTEVAELRLALKAGEKVISETWLFRWTQA